jgi:hypothetical protein
MDNSENIIIDFGLHNLGDLLWITPTANALGARCKINMINHDRSKDLSVVFENMCEVIYENDQAKHTKRKGGGHYAQQILRAYNIQDTPYCPIVKMNENQNIMNHCNYHISSISKNRIPVVVNVRSSGGNDPNNSRAHQVDPDASKIQETINLNLDKYCFFQFPIKQGYYDKGYSSFFKLENTNLIECNSLREKIYFYKNIKNYLGGDTGDYHLMLAIGGKCVTIIPDSAIGYSYEELLYTEKAFNDNKSRVKYVKKSEFNNESIEDLLKL